MWTMCLAPLWFILWITRDPSLSVLRIVLSRSAPAAMETQSFLFLVCLMMCGGDTESTPEICTGPHCQRSPSRSPDHQSRYSVYAPRRPSVPYTVIQPQHSRTGSPKVNPRTITAEVFNPQGCTGGGCHGSPRPTNNDSKECKGIGCKLPVRMRPDPKQHSTGTDVGRSRHSFVHMQDRAEQVLGEFPELGTRGGLSTGIQLTCDIKPGKQWLCAWYYETSPVFL